MTAETVVAAARRCIGTRFRPHGRTPGLGLDCVGLAAFAYGCAGARPVLPRGYAMRGGDLAEIARAFRDSGFEEIGEPAAGVGDLLLLRAGPRQYHLAVLTGAGFVHADAGLRRVVETPGAPPWPAIAAWRWKG